MFCTLRKRKKLRNDAYLLQDGQNFISNCDLWKINVRSISLNVKIRKWSNQLKIVVLRWGHRQRDFRVTTHVALTARAFGASGFILADSDDSTIEHTIENIVRNWGGSFNFKMGIPWRFAVEEWKRKDGIVLHLTAYGENIETSNAINRIKSLKKDIMLLVGSRKVPSDFFSKEISDFNLAIGNQPHSEVAALAVFLDRLFGGRKLTKSFEGAKLKILPSKFGKKVLKNTSKDDKNC